jgi:hypothetical protein
MDALRATWMLGLTLALTGIASAQTYSIDWSTIDGGGGTSSGGPYTLSGTIGQPDAGTMSGGNYSLTGGFWSMISAIPTEGSPPLRVFYTTTNTVVVAWPSPSTGYALQQNAGFIPANWANASQTPADDGTTKWIIINPPLGNLFFRLKK